MVECRAHATHEGLPLGRIRGDLELLPAIHRIEGVRSNAYLIVEPDGLTVIDTGMPGSGKALARYLWHIGYNVRQVRRILLTHQHVDHVGGAAELAMLAEAEVIAHPADAPAIEGTAPRDLPSGPMGPIFRYALQPRLRPVSVTRQVRAGETLPILEADGGLHVIEAPGHTRGQIAFYLPGRRLLFAGDAYVHMRGRIDSPFAMFNQDTDQTKRTLVELARTLDVDASLPGHGEPITRGAAEKLAAAGERLAATM